MERQTTWPNPAIREVVEKRRHGPARMAEKLSNQGSFIFSVQGMPPFSIHAHFQES